MNQSPNYRRIVLRLTDEALRSFGGAECTREVAAQLLEVWPGRVLLNDELRAEVLAGFVAEPPSVPGLDFLPAVEADAAVLVGEAVAALDEPVLPREFDDVHGCTWRESVRNRLTLLDVNGNDSGQTAGRDAVERRYGPLVEVPAPVEDLPAPEVWDDSVPPGGRVCSVCRTPVESEPCEIHGVWPDGLRVTS